MANASFEIFDPSVNPNTAAKLSRLDELHQKYQDYHTRIAVLESKINFIETELHLPLTKFEKPDFNALKAEIERLNALSLWDFIKLWFRRFLN